MLARKSESEPRLAVVRRASITTGSKAGQGRGLLSEADAETDRRFVEPGTDWRRGCPRCIAEAPSRVEVIRVTVALKALHAFAARAETNIQGLTVGAGLERGEGADCADTLPVTTTG